MAIKFIHECDFCHKEISADTGHYPKGWSGITISVSGHVNSRTLGICDDCIKRMGFELSEVGSEGCSITGISVYKKENLALLIQAIKDVCEKLT